MTNKYYCMNCSSCLFIEHDDDPTEHEIIVKELDTCDRCEMERQGERYDEEY